MKYSIYLLLFSITMSCTRQKNIHDFISIYIDNGNQQEIEFAIKSFAVQCGKHGILISTEKSREGQLAILLSDTAQFSDKHNFSVESYSIFSSGKDELTIAASDKRALIYGFQSITELLFVKNTPVGDINFIETPDYAFRTIKFNLPWDSYREHELLQLHSETFQDLNFWERILDMMAESSFNRLTLWCVHPWTYYMVRPEKYPEACPFNDEELATWQNF